MPDAWSWTVPEWARQRFTTTAPDAGGRTSPRCYKSTSSMDGAGSSWRGACSAAQCPRTIRKTGRWSATSPWAQVGTEITFPRRALSGEIKAAFIFGENPAVTNPNAKIIMAGLAALDLLVVSEIFETETAWFADVLLPAASFAEKEGTRTNGNRVIQWAYRAVPPKGDSRPEYWIITRLYHHLRRAGAVRLPSEVAGVKSEKVKFRKGGKLIFVYERPLRPDAAWDYAGGAGKSAPISPIEAEVNPRIINKEINITALIYQGIYDPIRDEFTTMRRVAQLRRPGEIDGIFSQEFGVYKDWGWAWPANVRLAYNYDSLKAVLGRTDKVYAAGKEWEVTGEAGEWIDEVTGEYRPAYIPGHNFWVPRSFKRKLSGIADIFGGLDIMHFVKTGEVRLLGKFVVEESGEVKVLTYDEFVSKTGWRYLWANDTLYWDHDTTSLRAAVKRPFFSGGDWRSFKQNYQKMRDLLAQYYQADWQSEGGDAEGYRRDGRLVQGLQLPVAHTYGAC